MQKCVGGTQSINVVCTNVHRYTAGILLSHVLFQMIYAMIDRAGGVLI
jgi:hypothetical protein